MVGKTVLIIAHRFSTIRDASMILVFDDGRVVATGSHAQLYGANPLYRSLYDRQQQNPAGDLMTGAPPPRMPKVSVLIPTYHYARFLPEAIESVLTQDFADFELLVSDDGSKDGSAEIIREYARRDPRIRGEIQPKNLGMVSNWNWCLAEARGDYVKFLFGDDRLASPRTLGRMWRPCSTPSRARRPRRHRPPDPRRKFPPGRGLGRGWSAPGYQARARRHRAAACGADRNLIGEPSAVMFRRAAAPPAASIRPFASWSTRRCGFTCWPAAA